jgi:AAA domain
MKWSPQQAGALMSVDVWHKECMRQIGMGMTLSKPIFRVFGYAGTGKTTLARHFATGIDGRTVYAAYTGKAAMVMKKSGCAGARTIHSLIYDVDQDKTTGALQFKWNAGSDAADAALIVIDECSMVDAGQGTQRRWQRRRILHRGRTRRDADGNPPAGGREPDHPDRDRHPRGPPDTAGHLRGMPRHASREHHDG